MQSPSETDQAGDFIEALGAEGDSSDVQRAVRVEVVVPAVVHRYLKKALILHRGADLIGARFVVELHLDGVVGPPHHEVVVSAVVHLKELNS